MFKPLLHGTVFSAQKQQSAYNLSGSYSATETLTFAMKYIQMTAL